MDFTIERNPNPVANVDEALADPGFGRYFTDHMVVIDWTKAAGWHGARVVPYGPICLNPANAVLHYAQAIFEGLKAYRHPDGSVHTFRPERNAARLAQSAHRLALPELPADVFIESLRQLVALDERWVPAHGEGKSLYLRPFMIANEDFLGVRAAETVAYYVFASPAGSYFSDPTRPVNIWLERDYVRAASRGGTGAAKCGGNYAASLLPQRIAYEHGCEQVLFLEDVEQKYVEELGGMNVVLVRRDGTILTPDSESILAGITCASVLELLADAGHPVQRQRIDIHEWRAGVESGEITEAFAVGTAAVIAPIGTLKSADFEIVHPPVTLESVSMRARAELTGIQNGTVPDRKGWLTRLV